MVGWQFFLTDCERTLEEMAGVVKTSKSVVGLSETSKPDSQIEMMRSKRGLDYRDGPCIERPRFLRTGLPGIKMPSAYSASATLT